MRYILSLIFLSSTLLAHKNYILVGPPGSGKGTFSSFMVEHGYHQICPGDIVRTHIKHQTELGKLVKPIIEGGGFLGNDILFKIVEEQILYCLERKIPFIIDGFPRHREGLDMLKQLFAATGLSESIQFIHFQVEDDICINRINARLVCFNCSSIYNLDSKKPTKDMACDTCKHSLEMRVGDSVAATVKRLDYYRRTIEPLLEAVEHDFTIIRIDASKSLIPCIEIYKELLAE
jgi:adenylate kinase